MAKVRTVTTDPTRSLGPDSSKYIRLGPARTLINGFLLKVACVYFLPLLKILYCLWLIGMEV